MCKDICFDWCLLILQHTPKRHRDPWLCPMNHISPPCWEPLWFAYNLFTSYTHGSCAKVHPVCTWVYTYKSGAKPVFRVCSRRASRLTGHFLTQEQSGAQRTNRAREKAGPLLWDSNLWGPFQSCAVLELWIPHKPFQRGLSHMMWSAPWVRS